MGGGGGGQTVDCILGVLYPFRQLTASFVSCAHCHCQNWVIRSQALLQVWRQFKGLHMRWVLKCAFAYNKVCDTLKWPCVVNRMLKFNYWIGSSLSPQWVAHHCSVLWESAALATFSPSTKQTSWFLVEECYQTTLVKSYTGVHCCPVQVEHNLHLVMLQNVGVVAKE